MAHRPLLLGHRGARATTSVAENSLASFDLALQHGCDGFEFDVRLTADGQGVICHDPRTNGMDLARTLREQLSHLASLRDVISRCANRAFLDIELKVPGLDEIVLPAVKEIQHQRYVISSFLPEVLSSLRSRDENLPLGFICDRETYLSGWRDMSIQYVIPHYKLATQRLVEDVHAAGKQVLVWTVNDRDRMLRLAEWGVDGIVSDETELLVKTLG